MKTSGTIFLSRFFTLLAAALILLAAGMIAPAAHGQTLVTYFNFNDGNPTVANLEASDGGAQSAKITPNNLTVVIPPPAGTLINAFGSDPAGNALRLNFPNNGGGNIKSFQFTVSTANLSNLSLTYATRTSNLLITQTLSYSTNGSTFTTVGVFTPTTLTFAKATFAIPAGAENKPSVTFKITLSSPGGNRQEFNDFDNIQLNGTAVPEPATTGAGLLGFFGLCWHQRRRLLNARQLLSFRRKSSA